MTLLLKKILLLTSIMWCCLFPIFAEDSIQAIATYNNIQTITIDADTIWLAIKNEGIVKIDKSGNEIGRISEIQNGFEICIDAQGNKWFATPTSIYEYSNSKIKEFSEDFAGFEITKIIVDGYGNLWAGTNKGVFSFNGFYWKHLSETEKYTISSATMNADYEILFGTDNGQIIKCNYYDEETEILHSTYYSITELIAGYEDRIFFMRDSRLSVIYSKSFADKKYIQSLFDTIPIFQTFADTIPYSTELYSYALDRNEKIWLGTSEGIVEIDYDYSKNSFINTSIDIKYFDHNSELENDTILDIAIDNDGAKWIVTPDGLSVFRDDGPGPYLPSEDSTILICDFELGNNVFTLEFNREINFDRNTIMDYAYIEDSSVVAEDQPLEISSISGWDKKMEISFNREIYSYEIIYITVSPEGIELLNGKELGLNIAIDQNMDTIPLSITPETNINIFPTITNNVVNVESTYGITAIELISIDGKIIFRKDYDKTLTLVSISTENIASGSYYVKCFNSNNTYHSEIIQIID